MAAGSAAFIAFNPMFLYMAGAINNDIIAALAGAAITYAAVRLLLDEEGLSWKWGVVFGLLFGLALLSKFNLAAMIVTIEAAVTWVAWRRRQWGQWLVVNALIAGGTLLLAGWWFGRNQILYGEPTGFQRLTELWGVRNPADSFPLAISELPYAWTSLWGRFGYGQIPLPNIIYVGLFVVALVAAAGYLVAFVRGRSFLLRANAAPLALLALNVLLFFGVLFNYLLVSPAGPMGRFFFPALPSLAILMFFGLRFWVPPGAQNSRRLALVTNGVMITLSLIALLGYLAPAYARPPAYTTGADLPNPVNAQFDSLVALRGYEIDTDMVEPGQAIDIELYWDVTGRPPGDYLLFVHLVDNHTGTLIAQRDTHPGLGNFPSSQWATGDTFVERLSMTIPETAYAPADGTLQIGLYVPGAYRLSISDGDSGEGLGDAYALGKVVLELSDSNGLPNAGQYNFEDQIRLAGYRYDNRVLAPGEPLEVTLYWEPLRPNFSDYEIHLEALDEMGQIIGSQSLRPAADWAVGEVVADQQVIPLAADVAGTVSVVVRVEDLNEGRRLNRVHPDGRWIDDQLELSSIIIRP